MLKKFQNFLSTGQDVYTTYQKKIALTSHVKIKNKQLSQELEQACDKKNGMLTYAEYLTIDQFGDHGFYANSKLHGKTDVEKRWGAALAQYCQLYGFDTIVEFGCGTGDLGIAVSKEYKKLTEKKLKWIGVEIDPTIHATIFNNFTSHNVQDSVERIVTTIDELESKTNVLIIFPYSLDNIPPHLFLNTQSVTTYPDAIVGVRIKNGLLSEVIIPNDILRKKGIALDKGFFSENGYTQNIKSWKIRKGQRAYISMDSYANLYRCVKKFGTKSHLIIIDEFRNNPWFFSLKNLGVPKSLYEHNFVCNDRKRYYHESGKHNFYYPLYRNSLLSFLTLLGYRSIDYDAEQKVSAKMRGKPWIPLRENYATLAFIARNRVEKKMEVLSIPFNHQRIL